MRQYLLALVLVCVLGAMVFPSIASAASWTVKNHSGDKMGKVVRTANGWCKIYDRAGRRCGEVTWTTSSGTRSYAAFKMYPGDQAPSKSARILKVDGSSPYDWYMDSDDPSGYNGFAMKKNGRWLVYAGHLLAPDGLRAKVSLACPGWAAAGSVFVLSRSFK